MDLLSLVLTLRPTAAGTPPPRLGRAAHAILLRQIAAQDPALAESLHSDDGPKPLTCSDLLGSRRREQVTPDETYALRYTALTAPVAAALANAFTVGQTLIFEDVTFEIVALTLPPTAPNPQSPILNPQSAVPSAAIPQSLDWQR